jgi:hypothetical protein
MTFLQLRQELSDRGFENLGPASSGTSRLALFVNQGRAELDNLYLWPYRLKSASGAAPLTVADLGVIEEVADTAQPASPALDFADRRSLKAGYGDLTTAGTPRFFYIDNGVVTTYPVGGTLAVRYYKRCPALSADADTPLAPGDFHMLYVDFAARWAAKDGEQPDGLSADIQRQLAAMVGDLLDQQIVGSPMMPTAYAALDW